VRRGAERALAEADATIDMLRLDVSQLEKENAAMVPRIVEIFPENSRRPETPKQRHACCAGSTCRCSAGSQPASWRRHTASASMG
jgi:hypothetical protein